jgi:hypothetical protein
MPHNRQDLIQIVVLTQVNVMYVINLSNISIKTNFKQIARVELKCVQYTEGDYILYMTSRFFFPFIQQRQVTVFCLTFQWYDVYRAWIYLSKKKIDCIIKINNRGKGQCRGLKTKMIENQEI